MGRAKGGRSSRVEQLWEGGAILGWGDVGVWVWEMTQWEKRKWGQENLRSAPQHPQKVVGHSSYCPGTIEARQAAPGDTRGTSSRAELSDLAFQRETSSSLFCCCGCSGESLTKSKLGVNHRSRDLTQKGHIMPTTALVGLWPVGGFVCFLANWMQSGRTNPS